MAIQTGSNIVYDPPLSAGSGSGAVALTGSVLPSLQASTEYVWTKTDGNGNLLDIVSFKTDASGRVPVGVS